MGSFKRFSEEKCFYRSVNDGTANNNGKKLDGHISNEDYSTCKKNWDKFDIKNMGDYHDHYFRKDALLLADVFEKFTDTCLNLYGLDPGHYFSSLGLRWAAMLKMIGIRLEKIVDIDIYLFIEKGLRGGISNIAKRCSDSNNEYMNNYDRKEPSKFIITLT